MTLTTLIILLLAILIAALVGLYVFYNRDDKRFTLDIGGAAPRAAGGNDASAEHTVRNRILGLGLVCTAVVGGLLARLWSMQLIAAGDYAEQAESNRTRTISIPASRGRILDRYGNEIVGNRPSLTVVAKPEVANEAIKVQLLANLIGMPAAAVRRRIQDQSSGAQSDRLVAADVSRRVVAFVGEHPYLFEGVTVEERSVRSYPYGCLAAHVVGYTGPVTTEILKESEKNQDQNAIVYEAGDTVGQAGLELQYENVLQGIRGEQNVYVDANGAVLEYATSVEPQAGSDLILTLDVELQQAAEDSLERVMKTISSSLQCNCVAGSAMVLDATNGEVLAMASAPTYSPNVFAGGISNDDWQMLQSEKSDNPLVNRAISGLYPSASTIKPIMAFAALDNGIATKNSSYYCAGWWTGFGESSGMYCWEHSGHHEMDLKNGISYSCDVVFYEIGKGFYESSDPEAMQAKLREWGLGTKTGIDLPGEADGRVPDAEWKWNYYTDAADADREWKGGDFANLAIGQGDLLVTPIQMACAYTGIATGGDIWRPHVMRSVQSSTGQGSVVDYEPQVIRTIDEPQDHCDLVHDGMIGAVYEESVYIATEFESLPVEVAAKSGTAERNGHNPTAWYLAYAPADDPKYVVAATIEEATWASSSALYVVRDLLGAIYDAPNEIKLYISPVDVGG
ncbi:MAG: penicillin-binding protein 2 [Coriobacteriales bacterium]|nr:penicillin-binding protein 2 [Coriobacteriales bacterium]